jgi:L-lactate dehydrogenase complex protein LldG
MVFKEQEAMTSREKILSRIKSNQPSLEVAAPVSVSVTRSADSIAKFKEVLTSIGGSVLEIKSETEISAPVNELVQSNPTAIILGPDHSNTSTGAPHALQNIDIAILRGEFGVAENGAIWITDKTMIDRALPFICSNLVLIVQKKSIVPTMHDAYDLIGTTNYGLGTFIAGPSKTADIEQSLVLGAHGAKTLTCFLLD